jgi:hypothetical protein
LRRAGSARIYLGPKPADVAKPIAEFQAVSTDEEGTRRLVKSVNLSLDLGRLPEDKPEKTFAVWWPELRAVLETIEGSSEGSPSTAAAEVDRLAEFWDQFAKYFADSTGIAASKRLRMQRAKN